MSKEIKILALIAFVVVVGAVMGANYYRKAMQSAPVVVNKNNNSGKSSVSPETLVRPDSATLGAQDAPVTLVEFYDPECESCAAFSPVVKKILKDYEPKVRLVARYMPLHPNSHKAATLTEAAGEQGKFWEMQELLFRKHDEWGERHGAPPSAQPKNIDALFEGYAKELGLDMAKVGAAVKENRYQSKLNRDQTDGQTLGVRKTPSFFVNGRMLMRFSEQDLRALIEDELKKY